MPAYKEEPTRVRRRAWLALLFLILTVSFLIVLSRFLRRSDFFWLSRLNFIYADEKEVLIISLEDKGGSVVSLNPEERLPASRGLGEYELGKVYALGELEKKGGEILAETIQQNKQVAIFGYFSNDSPTKFDFKKIVASAFWGKIKTNLGKLDLLWVFFRTWRLSEMAVEENPSFSDKKMRLEQVSLEILNSTDHAGLAQRLAALIEKAGGRIVRVADGQKKESECLLVSSEKLLSSYTLRWLKKTTGCPVAVTKKGELSRAELSLILGEGYWKKQAER